MRIIITTTGEKERQSLEKSHHSSRDQSSMFLPRLNQSRSTKHLHYSSILFNNNKTRKLFNSTRELILEREKDNDRSNDELIKAKHIKINQSPISTNLINSFSEMKHEESLRKLKKTLIPKSEKNSSNTPLFPMKSTNTQSTPKQNILMKDIINNEAYTKMMLKLRNEKNVADRNFVMTNEDFRSNDNSIRYDFNINDVLSMRINKNRADFIKYITNKRDLSPIFLKKLSYLDESKVYDLNRICQIIHSNRSKDELFKEKLNEKVATRGTLLIADANQSLNSIRKEIKMRKTLINGYSKLLIKNPMIDNYYQEKTQRFWDKFKVSTLQRKNNNSMMGGEKMTLNYSSV